jgi:Skp family chaperone for outer membrane proteins
MNTQTMKSPSLFGITFFLACSVSAVDLKIAAVDVAKVFSEYSKTKIADGKLQESVNNAKEGMQELLAEYKSLNDAAKTLAGEAQDAGLEAAVRVHKRADMQAKLNEIRLLEQKIQEFRQGRSDQLHQETAGQRKGLYDDIQKVISETARTGGYDLVFDRSGLSTDLLPFPLHAKAGVSVADLTQEVIMELNKDASAGAGSAQRKANAGNTTVASPLREVPFVVGDKRFAAGDDIVIDKVSCSSPEFKTGDRVVVQGHYKLTSIPEALLAL